MKISEISALLSKAVNFGVVTAAIVLPMAHAEETYSPPTIQKWINIRVDPLGFILNGTYDAHVDFKLGDQFTLGPYVAYQGITQMGVSVSMLEGGATLMYYPLGPRKEQISNWYISPQIGVASAKISYKNRSNTQADFKGQLTTGFSLMTQSGFNFQGGLGIGYSSLPAEVAVQDAYAVLPYRLSGTFFVAETHWGFAF